MLQAFFHGFFLALGLILPLGAQNVFVFNQGIFHRRWLDALPAVVMAALCDTLLILLAVLGVSLVIFKLAWLKTLMSVAGVLFLVYVGISTWKSAPGSLENTESNQWPLKRQLLFAASVSLLNPHAIVDTIGVIGTSSLAYNIPRLKFAFAWAAVTVSWIWFFTLMTTGHLIGSFENMNSFRRRINQLSAVIIWISCVILIKTLL